MKSQRQVMSYLFIACFALILYGTLFPFSFKSDADSGGMLAAFAASLSSRPGIGDALSNIVLFLPFGFLGMQAMPARLPVSLRLACVLVMGLMTSLGIEAAQHYLPRRNTSVYDLVLNSASVLIGAAVGSANWQRLMARGAAHGARPRTIFPLVMIAAWAAYRLFPYVPTIDFQHVKDAIKPLLDFYPLPLADVLRHFGMVLALGLLLQSVIPASQAALALPVMALGVIAAKPFIMMKVLSPAEVAGTLAALLVWFAVLHRSPSRTLFIAGMFALALAAQGLAPFELRAEPEGFSFIPFSGFVQGSMAVNLQSFLEKVFLYGTLVWLVVQAGGSTRTSLAVAVILTTLIELAQRHLVGRNPEITDPLLAIMVGGTLLALERHYRLMQPARE